MLSRNYVYAAAFMLSLMLMLKYFELQYTLKNKMRDRENEKIL